MEKKDWDWLAGMTIEREAFHSFAGFFSTSQYLGLFIMQMSFISDTAKECNFIR